jgi:hypothetical protein
LIRHRELLSGTGHAVSVSRKFAKNVIVITGRISRMAVFRIEAHELRIFLAGPGYILTDVTFDREAQTITLHVEQRQQIYTIGPITAVSALANRAPAGTRLANAYANNGALVLITE